MRERSELILKIVCSVLAALLFFQLTRMVLRTNPLRGVRIPELPTLPATLDAQISVKGTNVVDAAKGSNVISRQVAGTNATNTVAGQKSQEKGTNSAATQVSAKLETNSPANPTGPLGTNSAPTQASKKMDTNFASGQSPDKTPTNALSGQTSAKNVTNAVSARPLGNAGPQPFMSQPGMAKLPELPPIIQARIDKIAQSEILGPFMRPMPMALLGIVGKDAFLRAPSGQTGLVNEGGELGGIKLLRIGTNRVLIEQAGEKKELTMFSGLGSESFLPKQTPATNEPITKPK